MTQLSQVQIEIKSMLEEFTSLQNVSSHVEEIDSKLKLAYTKLKQLDKVLDKELKDIETLEGIGLRALFHKTLGDKEKQIEKERQEYLEASLQFNEHKKSIELMEFERDLLAKKLNRLPEIKKKIEGLKKKRSSEILASSDITLKNELSEILKKHDISIMLNKEISEALEEGEKGFKLVGIVINHLRQAGEWGRWDMYGDNRRAEYMKRQYINNASRSLTQAQHQLNLFSRELRDLGDNNISFQLNMVHFNKFTDFFFDNLISDWIVQQRIKSTLNNIESTHAHIRRILLSLVQEKQNNDKKLINLEVQKNKLLTS